MSIGGRIKAARKGAGLTQSELAHRLGVSPQCISQYERGVKKPKVETVGKIAEALGVSPSLLAPGIFPTTYLDALDSEERAAIQEMAKGDIFVAEIVAAYLSLSEEARESVGRMIKRIAKDIESNQ